MFGLNQPECPAKTRPQRQTVGELPRKHPRLPGSLKTGVGMRWEHGETKTAPNKGYSRDGRTYWDYVGTASDIFGLRTVF